jgi:hypothetical protein
MQLTPIIAFCVSATIAAFVIDPIVLRAHLSNHVDKPINSSQ